MSYTFGDISGSNYVTVHKPLGKALGVANAIILGQIQNWLEYNKDNVRNSSVDHFRNGRWWTYNSYEEWADRIQVMDVRSIRRYLEELVEMGLVIRTSEYNQRKADNTYWYTINQKNLDLFADLWHQAGEPRYGNGGGRSDAWKAVYEDYKAALEIKVDDENDMDNSTRGVVNLTIAGGQVDQGQVDNLTRALPIPTPLSTNSMGGKSGNFPRAIADSPDTTPSIHSPIQEDERAVFERRRKARLESVNKTPTTRDLDKSVKVKYKSPDSLPIIKAVVKAFGVDVVGEQQLTENQRLQLHETVKVGDGDYEYMSPVDLYNHDPLLVERWLEYLAEWWDKPAQNGGKKPKKASSKIVQFLRGYGYKVGILTWAKMQGYTFPASIGGKSHEAEIERKPQVDEYAGSILDKFGLNTENDNG